MIYFPLVVTEHLSVIFADTLNYVVLLHDSFEEDSKT